LYTSPHLHTFRERIRVDGELIPPDRLTALVEECRSVFDAEPELTTFEAITALAFSYFAQCQVDIAVIEVGLGGRLDATNVIVPEVVAITSLSFDHTYLLGDTLADIAYEKAGIIKPGIPTVCAPQPAEALAVIEQVCAERESALTLVGRDWITRRSAQGFAAPSVRSEADSSTGAIERQEFELRCVKGASSLEGTYTSPLLGRHQVDNAAVAIAVLDQLRGRGVSLQASDVSWGVANVRWPGRFEVLRRDPVLVVDCAHNGDSAAKLAAALEEWFPNQRWTFIIGVSTDKDILGILRALAPRAGRIIATESRHPRAMSSPGVAEVAAAVVTETDAAPTEITVTRDLSDALALALGKDAAGHEMPESTLSTGSRMGPVCVTGSIFVVAEAREAWALFSGGAMPEMDRLQDPAMFRLGYDSVFGGELPELLQLG
jgi:dihydrofolate synthase/folylpolyglutamate synthase